MSKAIDRQRNDRPDIVRVTSWLKAQATARGFSRGEIDQHMGTSDMAGWWLTDLPHRCQCPTWEQWETLRRFMGLPDDMDTEVWRLNGRKGTPGDNWDLREVVGSKTAGIAVPGEGARYTVGGSRSVDVAITAPATADAQRWQGWGTALKPAHEPIVVARKPLTGTVAANVLAHGTGALNIDAARIEGPPSGLKPYTRNVEQRLSQVTNHPEVTYRDHPAGRWPANVTLDETAAAALDHMSGERPSGWKNTDTAPSVGGVYGDDARDRTGPHYEGSGGASRFYFTAKASSDERITYHRPTCECEDAWPTTPSAARDTDATQRPGSLSTSKSGNSPTASPSPTATRSTISTASSSTTIPPTFSPSPLPTTNGFTLAANSEMGSGGSLAASAESSSQSPLSIGTSAPKAGRSTAGAGRATLRGWSETSVCGRCGAPSRRESHATVKPLALMRWLTRLVCPPGGTILEPFAGSGTTVEACLLEGFRCIAIEREADYLPLITQRLNRRRDPVAYLTAAGEELGLFDLSEEPA